MSRRHVFTVNLKDDPGIVEEYMRYHRDVWPEVQASLRRVGVEQMDIYLLGRRLGIEEHILSFFEKHLKELDSPWRDRESKLNRKK